MQDRFKFRYFYNGKIYDVFAVDFMNKTAQLVSLDRKETLMKGIDTDKLIQCTGLKDKNGKLIYENDIVKLPFLDPIFKNVISDENTELAIVEYYNGCFTAKYVNDNTRVYLYQFNNIEIIGNKYENKELLTGGENND